MTPEMMPGADVSIDDLPANPADWSPITRQPVVQDDCTRLVRGLPWPKATQNRIREQLALFESQDDRQMK